MKKLLIASLALSLSLSAFAAGTMSATTPASTTPSGAMGTDSNMARPSDGSLIKSEKVRMEDSRSKKSSRHIDQQRMEESTDRRGNGTTTNNALEVDETTED